jgi:xylan 1,4-beta-xylosidase
MAIPPESSSPPASSRNGTAASSGRSGARRHVIENPVLRGFHPDPSILRVGRDYYIATSTFEWFPGVRIHHSRDLVNWTHRTYALTRTSQLDLRGNPRSGGVWAPCLSFDGTRFWLVYTDVKSWGRGFLDARNYVVTAPSIDGPWSDPASLNASGFDPSLFHDTDGRKWLVNMLWDHRRDGRDAFGGIVLQEFDPRRHELVGRPRRIFVGSHLGITEGPHLYRRGPYYYLMVAEGGTGWDHCVTLARSPAIEGPYEVDPDAPLLTSRMTPGCALQKAGHGSLVEAIDGSFYLAHLCARPLGPDRRCILGRETALQAVVWTDDGWLKLASGGRAPEVRVAAPRFDDERTTRNVERARDDFDAPVLSAHFQTLRCAADPSWVSLVERPGFLRLRGRESLQSWHDQSLLARRIQSLACAAETCLEFAPTSFQHMAGLVFFYDDENHYYAYVTHDDEVGPSLCAIKSERGLCSNVLARPIALGDAKRVWLRGELAGAVLRFSFSIDGVHFRPLGTDLDATILSDECAARGLGFTGAFVGVCVQDFESRRCSADFDFFEYREHDAGRAPSEVSDGMDEDAQRPMLRSAFANAGTEGVDP